MLGITLSNSPTPVPYGPGLSVLNIDPDNAAESYRQRVIAALQDDLRRAHIEPYAWVLDKSILAAGTQDPLLAARLAGERKQIDRMASGLATRIFTVPWLAVPPIGLVELSKLAGEIAPAEPV